MASGKSVTQANAVLDEWLGSVAPIIPATWYVALFTVAPNRLGGGTEVTGGSYARVAIDNDLVTWTTASNGRKTNDIEIVFPQASAVWGTVVAVALVDTASGAYVQGYWGLLNRAVTVTLGQTRFFPVNGIEVIEA